MRTVKHQLKPLSIEQKTKLLDVMYAYQFEKNYFSDQLLNRSHEASLINLQSSYIQIRDKLVKDGYKSKYNLPARLWKMALKEAYDLHIRTHEAQVTLIKRNLNNNLYQYCHCELIKQIRDNQDELAVIHVIQCFEKFLYFATNALFFNYKTFCQFERKYFSKKFNKARVYQRAKTLLLDLLKPNNAVKKEVLTKKEAKQLKQLLASGSDPLFNRLFQHYCHSLVQAVQKFRGFKQIQSQINPTITLDGDCYDLYSVYDNEAKKNHWFLNIMSLESGNRIKGLELTGFHHAKQIMKHRKSANLVLSFDPNNIHDGVVYAHFTFGTFAEKPVRKGSKKKTKLPVLHMATKLTKNKQCKVQSNISPNFTTLNTVGGDFGLTECFTFSDGWVAGRTQGELLKDITTYTQTSIKKIHKNSKDGYFGLEKNNLDGRRNHQRNCFNHNSIQKNINRNYNNQQTKYNRRLENYKYQFVNEIIDHFTSDNIYGQYANFPESNPLTLVFEDLDYVNLGRNKEQKRQINLIKGVLTLLEEKIQQNDLPIKIEYVNPAYTSQTCPSCSFVDRKNRDSKNSKFRCQHCGFTVNDDVRYQWLITSNKVVQTEQKLLKIKLTMPSEDDFVASQNIAMRPSVLPNSLSLRKGKIKDLLIEHHQQIKGSCKIFKVSDDLSDSDHQ